MRLAERQQALRELANGQGGYFTSRQAEALGFDRKNHPRRVATGAWVRERHGIYRLYGVLQPNPAVDELHIWLLWTIRRGENRPCGAIGHETALCVYGLSDLMIHGVHLCVPPQFQPSVIPEEVTLHRDALTTADITECEGLSVVRPLRTLLDLLHDGRVSREHLKQALHNGLQSGEITRAALQNMPDLKPAAQVLRRWASETRT